MKEPEGLSVGKVTLSDGEVVLGVIGEPELVRRPKGDLLLRRLAQLYRLTLIHPGAGRLRSHRVAIPLSFCGMTTLPRFAAAPVPRLRPHHILPYMAKIGDAAASPIFYLPLFSCSFLPPAADSSCCAG